MENSTSALDVRLPLRAVRCLLRPRPLRRRAVLLLMLLAAITDRIVLSADVLLAFLYFRNKFHWDDVIFGIYIAYKNIVSFIGTLVILRVLKARLGLSDEAVGVLGGASLAVALLALAAAYTTPLVFLIPVVTLLSQGSQVVQRPILNKQIEPLEQGKVYSLVGAVEQAFQMGWSPLYAALYARTADCAPAAWLAPGALLALLQLASYAWARNLSQSNDQNEESKVTNDIASGTFSEGGEAAAEITTANHEDVRKLSLIHYGASCSRNNEEGVDEAPPDYHSVEQIFPGTQLHSNTAETNSAKLTNKQDGPETEPLLTIMKNERQTEDSKTS